jgi:hypothetical protein
LIREKNGEGYFHMTMAQMRDQICREGDELSRQNYISGESNGLHERITYYWSVRNGMSHERDYVHEMDHDKFQKKAKKITEELRFIQDALQRICYSNK